MLKNAGLKTKIVVSVCGIALISFAVTITYITMKASGMAKALSLEMTREMAYRYGREVKSEMDVAADVARTLAHTFAGMKRGGAPMDRETGNRILREVLEKNSSLLGVWCGWEPNAYDGEDEAHAGKPGHDDTGRFIPYWNRVGGIHNEPLMDYMDTSGSGTYYTIPLNTKKEIVMDPITYPIAGKEVTVVSICMAIIVEGRSMGVVGVDFSMDRFREMMAAVKPFETGYGFLVSNNGAFVSHPREDLVGTNIEKFKTENLTDRIRQGREHRMFKTMAATGEESFVIFTPIRIGLSESPWSLAMSAPMNRILQGARNLRNISVLIGTVSLVLLFLVVFFVTGNIIIGPVNGVVAKLREIAEGEGDLTMRLPVRSGDEIGELSRWFNSFMEKLQDIVRDVSENADTVDSASSGLLTISETMTLGSGQTSEKSENVASAAESMSDNMSSVAAAMEEASVNINTVASAAEEMTATISEIARNAEKASGVSSDAVSQVRGAYQRIEELGNSAREIGRVTEAITEISEQTNLLALNATIEAARAGEAGKGFAVVANEIKELAKQTARATREIKEKIGGIQDSTANTVTDIEKITRVINDINDIVTTIAAAVEEQSAATREIAGNISQASTGISEVNENVAQSSAAAEEITANIAEVSQSAGDMASGSSRLNASAGELATLAEHLKTMMGKFRF